MLEVKDLTIYHKMQKQPLVQQISFSLVQHESLGIIGESGSGKSLLCKAILGLLSKDFIVTGHVLFNGENILQYSDTEWCSIRGAGMTMIMQNALNAFNPLLPLGKQFEHIFMQNLSVTKEKAYQLALSVLEQVKLQSPHDILKQYPHQLSGGMLQRCMIAVSLGLKPQLIFADEPTTALDTLNQQRILQQLKALREEVKTALVFVSHDLSVVQELTQKVLVLQEGVCVEQGELHQVFNHPKHSYTRYLIATNVALGARWKSMIEVNGHD